MRQSATKNLFVSITLLIMFATAGCASNLSANDHKFYKTKAMLEAYTTALDIRMNQIRNGAACRTPCTWSSIQEEVRSFLETPAGQSYAKALLDQYLRADGWRLVKDKDGTEKYVDGEFLRSSRHHYGSNAALLPSRSTSGGYSTFLMPFESSVYGPGINADATGRPFIWQPDFGGPALGPITPNAYGPGIGMDVTGRPVRPACPPGWAGPC